MIDSVIPLAFRPWAQGGAMDLYFDFEGAYLGYMQSNGDFFDSWGRRWARLGSGGALYDLDGRHRGHVDAQGSLFDEHGTCWGYLRGWESLWDNTFHGQPRTGGTLLA